jgi:hypothetical protein
MAQCSEIETTAADFKSDVDYAIWRAVCGKPSPWLIDSEFEPTGNFQQRFLNGDQQILWEINCCAQKKRLIPKWAADALYDILFGMAKGGVKSWNDAFGRPYEDQKMRRGMATKSQMFDAYREVSTLQKENKASNKKMSAQDIYQAAGQRLRPRRNGKVVQELYVRVRKAITKGQLPGYVLTANK